MYYVIHVFPVDGLAHWGGVFFFFFGYVEYVEECRTNDCLAPGVSGSPKTIQCFRITMNEVAQTKRSEKHDHPRIFNRISPNDSYQTTNSIHQGVSSVILLSRRTNHNLPPHQFSVIISGEQTKRQRPPIFIRRPRNCKSLILY